MITIVLLVSRSEFLNRVISNIELLDCDQSEVNILAIVDGDEELFVKTRNLIAETKFANRLTVALDYPGDKKNIHIDTRRKRIAAAHNQAGDIIQDTNGYILSVEDDTLIGSATLTRLMKIAMSNFSMGFAEGVELGRWGVPYVGAWIADDLYETTKLSSVDNINPVPADQEPTKIDAGGLYCALIRADLYKDHTFGSDNGLGPDVNFGLWARRLGYENFIDWQLPCAHLNIVMGAERKIVPSGGSQNISLVKESDTKWQVTT